MLRSKRPKPTPMIPRLLAAVLTTTLAIGTTSCAGRTRVEFRRVPCPMVAVPPPEPPPELPADATAEQVEYDRRARSWHHATLTAYAWAAFDGCGEGEGSAP